MQKSGTPGGLLLLLLRPFPPTIAAAFAISTSSSASSYSYSGLQPTDFLRRRRSPPTSRNSSVLLLPSPPYHMPTYISATKKSSALEKTARDILCVYAFWGLQQTARRHRSSSSPGPQAPFKSRRSAGVSRQKKRRRERSQSGRQVNYGPGFLSPPRHVGMAV